MKSLQNFLDISHIFEDEHLIFSGNFPIMTSNLGMFMWLIEAVSFEHGVVTERTEGQWVVNESLLQKSNVILQNKTTDF